MKKIWYMSLMSVMTVVTPLISMERENVVQIMGDVSVLSIKESNLELMQTLYKHCLCDWKKNKRIGLVPRYSHVSPDEISLVNQALTVRPDQFADYYNQLSQQNRLSLIKTSGQYNEAGKKVMLDVPEVTKRLIEVYFDDDLRNYIKSYLKNEDKDTVRNYFREQLIYSKRLLALKQLDLFNWPTRYRLIEDVYLGSVFLDAFNTVHQYDYPIYLYTKDKIRKTYATYFAIDNYEYRITDVCGDKCLLWIVNHNNPDATFSTVIKLKGNIKGCAMSSTQTDVEGVLIYSDHEMVFSTIKTLNGVVCIDSVSVESLHQIVDVCFEPINYRWVVGTYEGLEYVCSDWNMQGEYIASPVRRSMKRFGFLEKIAICSTAEGYRWAEIIGVANLYSIAVSDIATDDGVYTCHYISGLSRPSEVICQMGGCIEGGHELFKVVDSINMANWRYSVLKEDGQAHKVYSPQGTFLMSNSLKNKFGMLYVETVLQDAITHKQIFSIDTLYTGFEGVGFSHDEKELFFFDNLRTSKVSLLNDTDKKMLSEIEDIACTNLGVASLMRRLCAKCKENKTLSLSADDPAFVMLVDWSKKSPELLQLLKTCLPITRIKK